MSAAITKAQEARMRLGEKRYCFIAVSHPGRTRCGLGLRCRYHDGWKRCYLECIEHGLTEWSESRAFDCTQ